MEPAAVLSALAILLAEADKAIAPVGLLPTSRVKLPMIRVKNKSEATVEACDVAVISPNTIFTDPLASEVTVKGVGYLVTPNVAFNALWTAEFDTVNEMLAVVSTTPATEPDKAIVPGVNVPVERVDGDCEEMVNSGAVASPTMVRDPLELEVTVKAPAPKVLLSAV